MSYTEYTQRLYHTYPSLSITPRCSCNRLVSLTYAYLCTNCSPASLRCPSCTSIAVDTYYCPSCLNSFFSKQAFPNENRCEQCIECPSCTHTLSTISRPTNGLHEYYYMCEACQWNSQSCHPPLVASDPSSLLTSLRDRDVQSQPKSQLQQLISTYNPRSQLTKDITPIPIKLNQHSYDEGDIAAYVKQRDELEQKVVQQHYVLLDKDIVSHTNTNIIAKNQVDEKMIAVTGKEIYDITTMTQRMAQTGIKAEWIADAIPRRKNLLIKTTHRCKKCNSYVVKPGAGASNLSFEIHHAAIASLPKITIGEYPALRLNQPTRLILYFKNPLVTLVHLSLAEKTDDDDNTETDEDEEKQKIAASTTTTTSPSNEPHVRVQVDERKTHMDAYDEIPEDNAIWADGSQKSDQDDPNMIASRHLSKVGVYVTVTPLSISHPVRFSLLVTLEPSSEPVAGFDRIEYEIEINLGMCSTE